MRRAFTLIELLLIVAIMATMVTVGVVGLHASRGATRKFAATRDVMAMVRRARSMALVTQKSVVLSYANAVRDGEACATVEIQAAKLFSSNGGARRVETLSGEVVREAVAADASEEAGETLEDVLSPQSLPEDLAKGLKLKVVDTTSSLFLPENETRHSKMSIFSTADHISRTLQTGETAKEATKDASEVAESGDLDEPFRVVFSANGMVSPPHRVFIYREGTPPEDGLVLNIDSFGEVVCE